MSWRIFKPWIPCIKNEIHLSDCIPWNSKCWFLFISKLNGSNLSLIFPKTINEMFFKRKRLTYWCQFYHFWVFGYFFQRSSLIFLANFCFFLLPKSLNNYIYILIMMNSLNATILLNHINIDFSLALKIWTNGFDFKIKISLLKKWI